jgi:hypothetical protein
LRDNLHNNFLFRCHHHHLASFPSISCAIKVLIKYFKQILRANKRAGDAKINEIFNFLFSGHHQIVIFELRRVEANNYRRVSRFALPRSRYIFLMNGEKETTLGFYCFSTPFRAARLLLLLSVSLARSVFKR